MYSGPVLLIQVGLDGGGYCRLWPLLGNRSLSGQSVITGQSSEHGPFHVRRAAAMRNNPWFTQFVPEWPVLHGTAQCTAGVQSSSVGAGSGIPWLGSIGAGSGYPTDDPRIDVQHRCTTGSTDGVRIDGAVWCTDGVRIDVQQGYGPQGHNVQQVYRQGTAVYDLRPTAYGLT